MKYGNIHVIKTEWKQRAFDKKWMLMGQVYDNENAYAYKNEAGASFQYVPTMWIVLDVQDKLPSARKG